MSQYFPKPYEPFGGDTNIKVDLSKVIKRNHHYHHNLLCY